MLLRKIFTVYFENHIKRTAKSWAKCRDFSVKAGGTTVEFVINLD
jgi:hypothetical protein